ncbi:oxidoreductase [Bradyrhizobium prioriisuperbiae]|uniref:oxidoreductase n=1 Tax=Bradyrhizobium prioriisuperbiae TaxID=2854389 RepID=UPI0028E204BA|nr:oxidoreductase [Bradyrhizobium prioritasuperba]
MPTSQHPIDSGFGAATTAQEVIVGSDLRGKTAIVTGGHSGIGLVTARVLASAGAHVVVPARDEVKARDALATYPELVLDSLDLMDPASIDAFAKRYLASDRPLDILVNNAGIMAPPLVRDSRGYESQFSTNHLGHFQLAARLWPALCAANGARVVVVSSRGHARGGVDFDDPNFEQRPYDRWIAYGQSKTANALFGVALDERGQEQGVRAFSLHPGGIVTDLVRYMTPEELRASGALDGDGHPVIDPTNNKKTPEQGAATTVWCATSHQLDGLGGVYCENCDVAGLAPADDKSGLGVRPWATDTAAADRLWRLSEQLTGAKLHGGGL